MKIYAVAIENFRGISSTKLVLPDHAVLIGDNNTGKSSVLEAIDLALGPDRLSRRPPVDEHDFYEGKYLPVAPAPAKDGAAPAEPQPTPQITVEVTIIGLSEEQEARFGGNIEWLNVETGDFFTEANPAGVDAANIKAALRVTFIGAYDGEEDDFLGNTYYARSLTEEETPVNGAIASRSSYPRSRRVKSPIRAVQVFRPRNTRSY